MRLPHRTQNAALILQVDDIRISPAFSKQDDFEVLRCSGHFQSGTKSITSDALATLVSSVLGRSRNFLKLFPEYLRTNYRLFFLNFKNSTSDFKLNLVPAVTICFKQTDYIRKYGRIGGSQGVEPGRSSQECPNPCYSL